MRINPLQKGVGPDLPKEHSKESMASVEPSPPKRFPNGSTMMPMDHHLYSIEALITTVTAMMKMDHHL